MAEKVVTTRDINIAIKDQLEKSKKVKISGLSGQDSIAVGLEKEIDISVKGTAGDFFGALNKGTIITLTGNARRFLGDTIHSGGIIVNGNVRRGAGLSMQGGIIIIRGEVDGDIGQLNKAGTIIVSENAGDDVGAYMYGGEVIVAGDTGKNLGNWMIGGAIYIGGEIESMGNNAKIVDIENTEIDKLNTYFKHYGIKAEPDKFRKIVPESAQIGTLNEFMFDLPGLDTVSEQANTYNKFPTLNDLVIITPHIKPPLAVDFIREDIQTEVTIGTDKVINPLTLNIPVFISPPAYGEVGLSTRMAVAYGAALTGTATTVSEGGSFQDELDIRAKHGGKLIVQWTPGRFGMDVSHLKDSDAIEIKLGGFKSTRLPDILPAIKNTPEVAEARKVPENIDLVSPVRHLDLDRPPDLKKHIGLLREITDYKVPIIVRIGAGSVYEDTRLAIRAGADAVAIEISERNIKTKRNGLTVQILNNVNLPDIASFALARKAIESIPPSQKRKVKILAIGNFGTGADIFKALALGADAVGIDTPALISIGCTECGKCDTNVCEAGIATLNPGLEIKLDWIEAGKKLMGFVDQIINELKVFTGITGNQETDKIDLDDLSALSYDTAAISGVKLAGYARRLPMWEH
jgi:glutamate synthase domain-containing protein 2/glutamate synthase domain-containing protein 3